MGVDSLPETVTGQRRGCDLNPGSTGRLVHVGETFDRFADFGCELHKMRLAAGVHPSRWAAIALPWRNFQNL